MVPPHPRRQCQSSLRGENMENHILKMIFMIFMKMDKQWKNNENISQRKVWCQNPPAPSRYILIYIYIVIYSSKGCPGTGGKGFLHHRILPSRIIFVRHNFDQFKNIFESKIIDFLNKRHSIERSNHIFEAIN